MDLNFKLNKYVKITIILYILVLVWVILFKFGDSFALTINYRNLTTLTTKERFLYDIVPFEFTYPIKDQKIEVFLNSIIFAPFGVLLCMKDNKVRILKHLLFCFGLSLIFEITQFFTLLGGLATDDLIMNTVGYFIGLVFYIFIFKKLSVNTNMIVIKVSNLILIITLVIAFITMIDAFPIVIDILLRRL
jgi:glycopeptide antibiotics resistance protein